MQRVLVECLLCVSVLEWVHGLLWLVVCGPQGDAHADGCAVSSGPSILICYASMPLLSAFESRSISEAEACVHRCDGSSYLLQVSLPAFA